MVEPVRSTPRPLGMYEMKAIMLVVVIALVVPLVTIDGIQDPLKNSIFGPHSSGVPLVFGLLEAYVLILTLRHTPSSVQRVLSFTSGIFVGLTPALFYLGCYRLWTSQVPIRALTVGGLIGGGILGVVLAWFIPQSIGARKNFRE